MQALIAYTIFGAFLTLSYMAPDLWQGWYNYRKARERRHLWLNAERLRRIIIEKFYVD